MQHDYVESESVHSVCVCVQVLLFPISRQYLYIAHTSHYHTHTHTHTHTPYAHLTAVSCAPSFFLQISLENKNKKTIKCYDYVYEQTGRPSYGITG